MPEFYVECEVIYNAQVKVEADTIEQAMELAESDAGIAGEVGSNAEYSEYRVSGAWPADTDDILQDYVSAPVAR